MTARAPYNFIPLPDVIFSAADYLPAGRLPSLGVLNPDLQHGWFDVTVTTETPLFIRGMLSRTEANEREQHRSKPDFFHIENADDPVIPGSSLRGMLRSLFEVVTFSKMGRISAQRLFFRTVQDSEIGKAYRDRMVGRVKTGFLRRNGDNWEIIPCDSARITHDLLVGNEAGNGLFDGTGPNKTPKWTDGVWRQYQPVWVQRSSGSWSINAVSPSDPHDPAYEVATLVLTGYVPGKLKEFVFFPPATTAVAVPVPDALLARFHDEDQVTIWQQNAFPVDQPVRGGRRKKGWLQTSPASPGEPVFYLIEGGALSFFGRAQMFRLPYMNSPADLLPPVHHDAHMIDMAEAVFGFVRDEKIEGDQRQSWSGRIRVTDAQLVPGQSDIFDPEGALTPPILSSPKPTTYQHYLTQPETGANRHYDTPHAALRGQKVYWRQKIDSVIGLEGAQRAPRADTQSTRMRPVNPGKQFRFRVEYENLTPVELGALALVLTLARMGRNARHMLGMGKPFGMGIVALEVSVVRRDPTTRYRRLFSEDRWFTGDSQPTPAAEMPEIDQFEAFARAQLDMPLLEHPRLQDLRVMLERKDLPLAELFGYMQVRRPVLDEHGRQLQDERGRLRYENEYDGRPLLPQPRSVNDQYQTQWRAYRRQEQQRRERELPVEAGSWVSGIWAGQDGDYDKFTITSSNHIPKRHFGMVKAGKSPIDENGEMKYMIVDEIEYYEEEDLTYYFCRRATKEERAARRAEMDSEL